MAVKKLFCDGLVVVYYIIDLCRHMNIISAGKNLVFFFGAKYGHYVL